MLPRKVIDIVIVCFFLFFSIWLMTKSFGYDPVKYEFRISRHQVGDFGLRLGLIRSFSWGQNIPAQSPFFPGTSLPYHYATDLAVGLIERMGLRIDHALNGVSVFFFVLLLYLIYNLSNVLFGYSPMRSLIAVSLFFLSSNLTFVDFLRGKTISVQLLKEIWQIPDYMYKGPFDGSVISIFSTLNPLLNQRHLIVGLALGILLISFLVDMVMKHKHISQVHVVTMGILLGLGTRIHSLVALGVFVVVCFLFLLFRRVKLLMSFILFTVLFAFPHVYVVVGNGLKQYNLINPGFLATAPVTVASWLTYWWQNLGLTLLFIPIGIFFAHKEQRKVFFSFLPLFILANIFQFSYRIEHNHSLVTLFLIVANIFVAQALIHLPKIGIAVCLVLLTASGILNLMVVKNDFQYRVADKPTDTLIAWIAQNTPKDTVFLAPQNLYDPVVLAGRKNYFGATYYSEVMGFDVEARRKNVELFYKTGKIVGVDYFISSQSISGKQAVFTNDTFWVYKL